MAIPRRLRSCTRLSIDKRREYKMNKKMKIRNGQLGLLAKEGDYYQILEAGEHRMPWFTTPDVTLIARDGSEVPADLADTLRRFHPEWVDKYCLVADTTENEAAALYSHGVLLEIIPPASHAGVLKIDGETQALLPPGLTAYWKVNHLVEAEIVDLRLQVLEVAGQEILTRDKVNLRLNLAANWNYSYVLQAFSQLTKPVDHLYRELQFALREAVGTRTLDELLENKQIIDDVVSAQVAERMASFGMTVASLGVKDIVLPGDMKTILTKLVEAEKSAQANVIRRREETAATRSLLNTAKVMESNPVALRLKELETLVRVAERIDKISVFGGLDQVLHGLVNIKGEA